MPLARFRAFPAKDLTIRDQMPLLAIIESIIESLRQGTLKKFRLKCITRRIVIDSCQSSINLGACREMTVTDSPDLEQSTRWSMNGFTRPPNLEPG